MRSFLVACLVLSAACSSTPQKGDAGTDGGTGTDASSDGGATDAPASDSAGGCGNAAAVVNGTMLGVTLSAKDATYAPGSSNFVILGDFTGICALGNDLKASSNVLVFDFYGTAPAPGTIQVGAALDVQFAEYNQTCNSPAGESASSGSVTITKADSCGVEGTFDVTLNSDHVTGSFTAPTCSLQPDGGASACK